MSWLSEAVRAAKPSLVALLVRALVLLGAALVGEQLEPVQAVLKLSGL